MRDYTTQNPQFAETIRILEPYDPGTAESVNITTEQLLQNDLVLKKKIESDIQELNNNTTQEINKKANASELKQIAYTANFNDLVNKPPSMLYSDTEPSVVINGSLWIG